MNNVYTPDVGLVLDENHLYPPAGRRAALRNPPIADAPGPVRCGMSHNHLRLMRLDTMLGDVPDIPVVPSKLNLGEGVPHR